MQTEKLKMKSQEIFRFLTPKQVDALSNTSEIVRFKSGETVYSKGAPAEFFFSVMKGKVTLRLPLKEGVSVLIDQVAPGVMFGTCICFRRDSYALDAHCAENSELLKIKAKTLKKLMDDDLKLGHAIQTRISQIYFDRYIQTMKKLQAVVMNVPLGTN